MSLDALQVLQDNVLNCHLMMRLVSGVKYHSQMSQDVLINKEDQEKVTEVLQRLDSNLAYVLHTDFD